LGNKIAMAVKGATILIADDNEKFTGAVRAVLEPLGYHVVIVDNGEDAYRTAVDHAPDLVLLDIDMPVMDGHTACKKLSDNPQTATIPIVIISGRKELRDRVSALKAGATDFFTKPLHSAELKAKIESLLKLKSYNDSVAQHRVELSKELKGKKSEIDAMISAYDRFVPKEFLKLIGKETIADVEIGDQVHLEIAILFSDIRSFTSLSEKMTPQQNFNFLNSYLKRMDPFIWNNEGFIDKYIGDAIMALFPKGPESALRCAIDMIRYLPLYNEHRASMHYDPIRIGIGLHFGPVMLGTIGHDRFMQGTVISSNVNLTARLENLTKMYGVSIIASNNILFGLSDPSRYAYRFLDKIKVRGMDEPASIFEVYEGDQPELKEFKAENQETFEKAVYAFHAEEVEEAYSLFNEIDAKAIQDNAVRVYLTRCEKHLQDLA